MQFCSTVFDMTVIAVVLLVFVVVVSAVWIFENFESNQIVTLIFYSKLTQLFVIFKHLSFVHNAV